jgi:hypothetical protein
LFFFSAASAEMRVWTQTDGNRFAGEFHKIAFGKLIVKDAGGKIHFIPLKQLSKEDLGYLSHHMPPEIEISVRKKERTLPEYNWSSPDFDTVLYTFSIILEKTSPLDYVGNLTVELFALGQEVDEEYNDQFVLMECKKSIFQFSPGEEKPVEVTVPDVRFYSYIPWQGEAEGTPLRGKKYAGYIVAVYDPTGNLLAHKENLPTAWLKEDVPHTVEELQRIWRAGNGSAESCQFNRQFREISPPRMPWFKRSVQY